MSEALKPSQLLPTYAGWYDFIRHYGGKPITRDNKNGTLRMEYKTLRGVINTINFSNKTSKTNDYEPTLLIQKYSNPHMGFRIEVSCNDKYLSNQLDIAPLADPFIHHLAIENESIFSDSKWENSQRIFLLLDKDYLVQLKKLSLLPNNAKDRIRIHKTGQEINISIMVEGEKEKEKKRPLAEKTLRKICQETGFNFDFNPMEQVTEGSIGNINFRLDQPRLTALDPAKVWDSLTSQSPKERFIFPVHV